MEKQILYKLVTFVPTSHADDVRDVMGKCGAGIIGNYSFCTFSTKGIGRFMGNEESNPTVGQSGQLEQVEEERIETVCPEHLLETMITEIKKVHPYEEVPFDIYKLESISNLKT